MGVLRSVNPNSLLQRRNSNKWRDLKKKSPQWNLLIEFFECQMKNNNVLIFIFI